jgi:hypothetical protein
MGASVVLVVVDTAMTGVPTTAVGGIWSGIARMCLGPLPTLPGLLALEIVGKKLQETLRCVARRPTHLLVVLVFPLVTSL